LYASLKKGCFNSNLKWWDLGIESFENFENLQSGRKIKNIGNNCFK